MSEPGDTQRLDQWLWHARFFKTRGLATKVVSGGHVRVDGIRVSKPAHALRPQVTLTFPQAKRIRVVQVEALATRRGPAPEAQALYTDLTPVEEAPKSPEAQVTPVKGWKQSKQRRPRKNAFPDQT